jgi:hypothetical protein
VGSKLPQVARTGDRRTGFIDWRPVFAAACPTRRFGRLFEDEINLGGFEAGKLDWKSKLTSACNSIAKISRSQPAFSAKRLSARM